MPASMLVNAEMKYLQQGWRTKLQQQPRKYQSERYPTLPMTLSTSPHVAAFHGQLTCSPACKASGQAIMRWSKAGLGQGAAYLLGEIEP
jgi:hypothetical protein